MPSLKDFWQKVNENWLTHLSQGNNNNHTQPVVNRLTLLLNCKLASNHHYPPPSHDQDADLISFF